MPADASLEQRVNSVPGDTSQPEIDSYREPLLSMIVPSAVLLLQHARTRLIAFVSARETGERFMFMVKASHISRVKRWIICQLSHSSNTYALSSL